MSIYDETHRFYRLHLDWDGETNTRPIVEFCRQELGDNNINERLELRPWFTCYNGIWIRRDCVSLIETFIALQAQ